MEAERKSARNYIFTRCHPQCRLCSYSGFSNVCTFLETGVCPYNAIGSANKNREGAVFGAK